MEFIHTAMSRNTSPELMEAIFYVAGENEERAVRVWEDPTNEELIAIWERVTKNGLTDSHDYYWGAEGTNWFVKDED